MLSVKQLLSYTRTFKSKLVTNAGQVRPRFDKKVKYGKDFRGYYKAVKGRALSAGAGKKWKNLEFRFYYPAKRSHKDQYIPVSLRPQNYMGPEEAPQFTHDTKVFVFCTCEWFLFACEVADEATDNSQLNYMRRSFMSGNKRITQNNGQGYTPDGPNPSGVPHLCKHLIAALIEGVMALANEREQSLPQRGVIPPNQKK